jgi:hypothetical protein
VEAPLIVRQQQPLDPLQGAVLRTLQDLSPLTLDDFAAVSGLGPVLFRQLLRGLADQGLVMESADHQWQLRDPGRRAVQTSQVDREWFQRRTFHFFQGRIGHAPRFLALANCSSQPQSAPAHWNFSVQVLRDCLARPAEWKQRHGFPEEIVQIVPFENGSDKASTIPTWQRVVLVHAEQLPAALILSGSDEEHRECLGFVLDAGSWGLLHAECAFRLAYPLAAAETFGKLLDDPKLESWRSAWRGWCQSHGIGGPGVEACRLVRHDHFLRVLAPAELLERLRQLDPEVWSNADWLLAGEGIARCAAQLEILTEQGTPPAGFRV